MIGHFRAVLGRGFQQLGTHALGVEIGGRRAGQNEFRPAAMVGQVEAIGAVGQEKTLADDGQYFLAERRVRIEQPEAHGLQFRRQRQLFRFSARPGQVEQVELRHHPVADDEQRPCLEQRKLRDRLTVLRGKQHARLAERLIRVGRDILKDQAAGRKTLGRLGAPEKVAVVERIVDLGRQVEAADIALAVPQMDARLADLVADGEDLDRPFARLSAPVERIDGIARSIDVVLARLEIDRRILRFLAAFQAAADARPS